jgi:hypothetical protein
MRLDILFYDTLVGRVRTLVVDEDHWLKILVEAHNIRLELPFSLPVEPNVDAHATHLRLVRDDLGELSDQDRMSKVLSRGRVVEA